MAGARPLPHVDGVEHRFVQAGELRMHVAEAGEGEPVVLLHGWPQHWYAWRGVMPLLAAHYRVICPDLRGLGWSDAPPGGYDKTTLAEDVLRLLDELGLGRVRLVGHDWGGLAGFFMCLRAPERIERFLVMNTAHPWPRVTARQARNLWRLWYQLALASPFLGPRLARPITGAAYRTGVRNVPREEWAPFMEQFRERERQRATQLIYRTFLLRELPAMTRGRYDGERLRVPTRFLVSEGDPVVRREMIEPAREHADDLGIESVPGHGHFLADEAPELVVERALEFFRGSSGPG
jgi:pimeloyl-ACP methyl ester carboxylesterase